MKTEEIQKLREDYQKGSLDESDVDRNPYEQFKKWLDEAVTSEVPEPNSMSLATVDASGKPHARIVLLKGIDERGFIFYSNYDSDKGNQMDGNPNISLCFLWKELERQVRISGKVTRLDREESEEYFKSRPRMSQLGALASNQSEEIESRAVLEERFSSFEAKYEGKEIPMPEQWGGYMVEPTEIEFWQGRRSRLHDRIVFSQDSSNWKIKRLSP